MVEHNETLMTRALDVALSLNVDDLKRTNQEYRAKHPELDRWEMAVRFTRNARWLGAAIGFGSGVVGNPWIALPAAVAETGKVVRMEVALAAQIALLFDETYLDDGQPPYELLVPIIGGHAVAEVMKEALILGGRAAARAAVRRVLTKEALAQFRKVMLKWFGKKIGQRALISKTLPIVGGGIGAVWNYAEIGAVGKRAYKFFEDPEKAGL